MRCQHPTLEGSQSMGEKGLRSVEPGGGEGGGKRNTAHAPSPGLREGPLGHTMLVSQKLSRRPGCISSPARCCTFHAQTQTPAVDSTESSCPGYPTDRDQAPRPMVSLWLHRQTNTPEIPTTGPARHAENWPQRMLQQGRVWNPTLDAQGSCQAGRTHTPGQLPILESQPQRSQLFNWSHSFPICQ